MPSDQDAEEVGWRGQRNRRRQRSGESRGDSRRTAGNARAGVDAGDPEGMTGRGGQAGVGTGVALEEGRGPFAGEGGRLPVADRELVVRVVDLAEEQLGEEL